MHKPLALLLVLAATAFAGCGEDDVDTATDAAKDTATEVATEAPEAAEEAATAATDAAGVVPIAMKDIKFDPEQATVKVGQKVVWANADDVQHDADGTSGEEFDTELVGQGGTVEFTPTKAGTIEYVCSVHPNMKGKLIVEE